MDPSTDLPDLVEDLEAHIDELTTTLHTLPRTTSTLPLLDRAKLHTLTAYAIESLLFSALLTAGTDAKAHPIFTELARLKTYFAKIKHVEEHIQREAEREGRARLDVAAAQRFIKHGLSGNQRYDEMRRERMVGERERAIERVRGVVNKRFDEREGEVARGRGKRDGDDDDDDEEEDEKETPRKKAKVAVEDEDEDEDDDDDDLDLDLDNNNNNNTITPTEAKDTSTATATRTTRSTAPKTRSEAFQALVSGSGSAAGIVESKDSVKDKGGKKTKANGKANAKGKGIGKARGKGKGK